MNYILWFKENLEIEKFLKFFVKAGYLGDVNGFYILIWDIFGEGLYTKKGPVDKHALFRTKPNLG